MKQILLIENNHGYISTTHNPTALMQDNKEGCQPKYIRADGYGLRSIDKESKSEKELLYSTGKHWIILWAPALTILSFYISAFRGVFTYRTIDETLAYLISSLLYTIIFLFLLYHHLRAAEFIITNKRILMKTGQFNIKSVNTSLTKIKCIKVLQGPIGKIFNFGSIFIRDSRGINTTFMFVRNPIEFREKAQEQRDLIQCNAEERSVFN